MTTTIIELKGGFRDFPAIRIRIGTDLWGLRPEDLTAAIDGSISPYQRRRLERHFCGIKGCQCGSWQRAEKRVLNDPYDQE